jgi:hypothetical protein
MRHHHPFPRSLCSARDPAGQRTSSAREKQLAGLPWHNSKGIVESSLTANGVRARRELKDCRAVAVSSTSLVYISLFVLLGARGRSWKLVLFDGCGIESSGIVGLLRWLKFVAGMNCIVYQMYLWFCESIAVVK